VPLRQRLVFSSINSNTHSKCNIENIVKSGIDIIKDRIDVIDAKIQSGEKLYFNASKTAQNAINFLNKELINEMLGSADIDIIQDMFRLLNILINKESGNDPINSFFVNIAAKGLSLSNTPLISRPVYIDQNAYED
jgi:hypothetical protein